MLDMEKVTETQMTWFPEINALYMRAFPENERRELEPLLHEKQQIGEVFVFCEDGHFVGFACLLNCLDIAHIIYFAVLEELRDRGFGSEILSRLCREKAGMRVIVDIERSDPKSENNAQRQSRKQFYLKNGFTETPVKYRWRKENYEILSYGGEISKQDFHRFWREIDRKDREMLY